MTPIPSPSTRDALLQLIAHWRALWSELYAVLPERPLGHVLTTAAWEAQEPGRRSTPYEKYPAIPQLLNTLLEGEEHLRLTCRDSVTLARALDILSMDRFGQPFTGSPQHFPDARIADDLLAQLFEASYRRRAYLHLYNLYPEQSFTIIQPLGAALREVRDLDITEITGEPTGLSTIHPHNTGNTFVVFEGQEDGDDTAWCQERWRDAFEVLGVLRYLKYGIVDIDYSVIHFTPQWLNLVRRYGIPLWGRPRVDIQPDHYTLAGDELLRLQRYLTGLKRFAPILRNKKSTMQQAVVTAGSYYESHHTRSKPEDQLIDLVIALEALFSPSDRQELGFRVSQSAALLLGNNSQGRRDLAAFLRRLYDARSRLVHEGKSPFQTNKLGPQDVSQLGDLVRGAILRFLVLWARGHTERNRVLGILENGAYDPGVLGQLRDQSQLESFLSENGI